MPLDPNISLATRGVTLPNPLEQYSNVLAIRNAQTQNQMNQMQMQKAQREVEVTNAMNRAYTENYDPKTGEVNWNGLRGSVAASGFGSELPGIEKRMLEMQTTKLTQQKGQADLDKSGSDLFDSRMKQIRDAWSRVRTPEDAMRIHLATHSDPVVGKRLHDIGATEEQGRASIMEAAKDPSTFAQFVQRAQLGAEKFMEMNAPKTHIVDQTGQKQVIQIPGMGGKPTTVGVYADVPLPAAIESQKSRIARSGASNISLSTEKKYGEKFGGLIADQDAAKLAAAEGAPQMAATSDRILALVEGGKVFTGTFANPRLQIAKALNLVGNTDAERIRNTEVLVSSLADTTMGFIKSSGLGAGQGFTNTDREFLEKAKAGQITYDAKSLAELARLSRRAAEKSAEVWNNRVRDIPSDALQGTGISTNPVKVPPRSGNPSGNIPADAISDLKSGKGTREQFDAVFGKGAADRALGKVK